jgi:osmotically inducible protein OsmC
MATERTAEVEWTGDLLHGEGTIAKTSSTNLEGLELSWPGRTNDDSELTSPEELVAAGLAACFAMSVAYTLAGGGFEAEQLKVSASLTFEPGTGITAGGLTLDATVPGISDEKLWENVERAKSSCPIVNALAGVDLTLDLPGVERPTEDAAERTTE